jgi:hypothetical protein
VNTVNTVFRRRCPSSPNVRESLDSMPITKRRLRRCAFRRARMSTKTPEPSADQCPRFRSQDASMTCSTESDQRGRPAGWTIMEQVLPRPQLRANADECAAQRIPRSADEAPEELRMYPIDAIRLSQTAQGSREVVGSGARSGTESEGVDGRQIVASEVRGQPSRDARDLHAA